MAISAPTNALSDSLTQQLFSRRELILPQAGVLWRIERGAVRTLNRSEEGRLITLGYWGPGNIVGHSLSWVEL